MTEDERRAAIERHKEILHRSRSEAQASLADIANGHTQHVSRNGGPMLDVTEARAAHLRGIVRQSDEILAAYEAWDA